MQKTFTYNKLLSRIAHATSLATLSGLTLVSLSQPIAMETEKSVANSVFSVSFSQFSPAFAAFEDEFLFSDNSAGTTLTAGADNSVYRQHLDDTTPADPSNIKITPVRANLGFDGSAAMEKIDFQNPRPSKRHIQLAQQAKQAAPVISGEELKFGSLATMVPSSTGKPRPTHAVAPTSGVTPAVHATPQVTPTPGGDVIQQSVPKEKLMQVSKVEGQFQLKDGLAFLGTMEVSWVVGDYEWARGSINTQDATYSIPVDKPIGDVVFSLYDNRDQLIGEGFVDLTRHTPVDGAIFANIDVLPINWDLAGKVIDGYSLGMNQFDIGFKPKTIEGVDVQLYSYNERTMTSNRGEFSFYNWKKSNSRTLAIASKKGFVDSIFSLDSRTEASVILFKQKYIDNLLSTLEQQGVYGLWDKGIIYGSLSGQATGGYTVAIAGQKPVYFQSGMPWVKNSATSSDGLFAFVGLEDGDYEVEIIKDGEIIDHKVVVVEQGKVSPILVNINKITKHLQYYDPLNPDQKIDQVVLSFFDGQEAYTPDQDNMTPVTLTMGSDPSIVDYTANKEIVRTFVSRSKDLQRLPLIQDRSLLKLAESQGLELSRGLIIGFVEQVGRQEPFKALLIESRAEHTLYFNSNGQIIDPNVEAAFGFIIGGFSKGLSSLLIERATDGTVLSSDFIFSDHQAISVVDLVVTPLN